MRKYALILTLGCSVSCALTQPKKPVAIHQKHSTNEQKNIQKLKQVLSKARVLYLYVPKSSSLNLSDETTALIATLSSIGVSAVMGVGVRKFTRTRSQRKFTRTRSQRQRKISDNLKLFDDTPNKHKEAARTVSEDVKIKAEQEGKRRAQSEKKGEITKSQKQDLKTLAAAEKEKRRALRELGSPLTPIQPPQVKDNRRPLPVEVIEVDDDSQFSEIQKLFEDPSSKDVSISISNQLEIPDDIKGILTKEFQTENFTYYILKDK